MPAPLEVLVLLTSQGSVTSLWQTANIHLRLLFRFYGLWSSMSPDMIASKPYCVCTHFTALTRPLSQDSRPPSSPLPLLAGSSVSANLKLSAGVI